MQSFRVTPFARGCAAALLLFTAACVDQHPTAARPTDNVPETALQVLDCRADLVAGSVSCARQQPASGASLSIIGGANDYVALTSSNLSIDVGLGLITFEVTVQNLLNEGIGTPDGVTVDADGIRVFFAAPPAVTKGTGSAYVLNADGAADFTGENQSFFQYPQKLAGNEVSASKPWQILYDAGAKEIKFQVYVSAAVQPLLVINEVMVNPVNAPETPTVDTDREWFEVYNAGRFPVNMQGMVIADSAATGRRPYKLIDEPVLVAPGGYAVVGMNTNTTANGGAVVDYAYGAALSFANSLDALKISRVVGTDTLTIDRTQYASAAVSAQSGISRELKNPAFDNANMDGSNWDDASVTAVYGAGGRGTPRAQNSTYTP